MNGSHHENIQLVRSTTHSRPVH